MMTKIEDNQPVKRTGSTRPDTCRVRLVWWPLPSSSADKAWGKEPPHCREVVVEILGIWSPRQTYFTAHAIFPLEPLPPMNHSAQFQFLRAVRTMAAEELSTKIEGVRNNIVDWEGSR